MRDQGLGSWMARRARISPRRTALTFGEQSWTYQQLADRVVRVANALRGLGVRGGERASGRPASRVAYLGPNHPAFLETFFATGALGAVFVPINPRLPRADVELILADAAVEVLVYATSCEPLVQAIQRPPSVRELVQVGGDGAREDAYQALVSRASDAGVDEEVHPDDLFLLAYTSGTTGAPKGVMLTHANLTWNVVNFLAITDYVSFDRLLQFAPLCRLGGLGVSMLPMLFKGGTTVLRTTADPQDLLEQIARHSITVMFGSPEVYAGMLQSPAWASADLSSLRFCVVGGAPVPEALLHAYRQRGVALLQGYGITEASPMALMLAPEDAPRRVGSAGRPSFFTDVRVVKPDGTAAAPGEVGEIVLRGPNVTSGYWNRPDATRSAFSPADWFHTGDAARVDAEGFIYVLDRLKDLIRAQEGSFFPAQVEKVLAQHPAVEDAAVVALPEPSPGAPVCAAFVVLRKGQRATAEALLGLCRGQLPAHQVPREVQLVPEIPRNASAKIQRWRLQERLRSGGQPPRSDLVDQEVEP